MNSTSGVEINQSSMMEVFDSKEKLVFGLPVASLPAEFDVNSAGYYAISLQNVTMQGARLVILHDTQVITLYAPYGYLLTPSKVAFAVGAILSSGIFILYLRTRSNEQKNRSHGFLEIVETSSFLRIFCIGCSAGIVPLGVLGLLSLIFGSLPSFYVAVALAVSLLITSVYWLKLDDIVALFLSVFGYGALLSMKKLLKYSMFPLSTVLIFFYTAMIWPAPAFTYDTIVIYFLYGIPFMALLTLLLPFIDPLTSVGEARLALQDFLSEFQHGSENCDFRYIGEASKCIASIIGENCSQVSCQAIEEHITSDVFAQTKSIDNERSELLIRRVLAALNPVNMAALTEIFSEAFDQEDRKTRPRFDRTLELLTLLISILGTIASIAYFLK